MNENQYKTFLSHLKGHIEQSRLKAVLSVNKQMIQLYWEIGRYILEQQAKEGWGTKVIDRLAKDLRISFPEMKGLSARNLKRMRRFAETYPNIEFVPTVLAQISWSHHVLLMEKFSDNNDRFWYMEQAVENGWSYRILMHQIELGLHETQGKLPNNFEEHLPAIQSDLVRQIFKDEYIFDFLSQNDVQNERALEKGLTSYITEFLLALGKGFAFIGRQYHLEVGEQDFYIDLLFYHVKLHCYIVVELKTDVFKPEYAGKLNFYLSAVDDLVRQEEDKPTIGLLLCKNKNNIVVEYALRDVNKPMGVAAYHLTKKVPDELAKNLPSEAELKQILQEINLQTKNKK
jgi:predicted nuclease of restriction endonuclease-like (RecB) superfamily